MYFAETAATCKLNITLGLSILWHELLRHLNTRNTTNSFGAGQDPEYRVMLEYIDAKDVRIIRHCCKGMRTGWFCRYQLSIVSNLAGISVSCTDLLPGEDVPSYCKVMFMSIGMTMGQR